MACGNDLIHFIEPGSPPSPQIILPKPDYRDYNVLIGLLNNDPRRLERVEQVADDVHRERRHAALGNQEGFPAVVGIHGDIDDQDGMPDGMSPIGLVDQNIARRNLGEGFLFQFVTECAGVGRPVYLPEVFVQRLVVGPATVLHRPVLERLEVDVRVPSLGEKVFASHPLDGIAALLVLGNHREIQYGVPEILSMRQAPVVVLHMAASALQREFPEVRPETPGFHLDPLETHRWGYLTDGFTAGRVADAAPKKPGHSSDQDDGDGGEPEDDSFDLFHDCICLK